MPTYNVPNFNLRIRGWNPGHTPAGDPPDHTDVPAQLYVRTQSMIATDPFPPVGFKPSIFLRFPTPSLFVLNGSIWEPHNEDPGAYNLVVWLQKVHLGFPNEYLLAMVSQCDAMGTPS